MVRIGIIGCGKITERASLPNLVNYKDRCSVRALCDIVKDKAVQMRKKFELEGEGVDIVTDYRELFKRGDIDAIFVNTPNYLHEEVAVGAAKAKKHILVEKPLTISLKAADNIINAAKKAGVFLMVEQTHRFDPVHIAAKKVIDSGILGKIHNIRGRIGHAGPEYWSQGKGKWFYDKKKSGGGVMIDIGVHIADLIRWFSDKKVIEVFATIQTLEKKVSVDDNATVLLKFEGGSKGEFECSWTTRPYEVLTFIYGEKGKMTTALGREHPVILTLAKTSKGEDPNCTLNETYPAIGQGSGWENAIHHFIDCLQMNKRPSVPGEEGKRTVEVILAAYQSAQKGRWVKLPFSTSEVENG